MFLVDPHKNKTYLWQGLNLQGGKITGEISAASIEVAKLTLQQQGILLIKISKKNNGRFNWLQKKVSTVEQCAFFRQLATLMLAHVPLLQSLELLLKNKNSPALQQVLALLKTQLETGKAFAQCLTATREFDLLSCHLIHIGEQTGRLAPILVELAKQLEKNIYFKKKIQQALCYPAIVFLMAIIISLVMLIGIVPRFEVLFVNWRGPLPLLTRCVMRLSDWTRHFGTLSCAPIIVGLILSYCYKTNQRCKLFLQKILITLPWFGSLFKKINLSRFSYQLATTLAAGAPMLEGIKLVVGPTESVFDQAIACLEFEISNGQHLYRAMRQSSLFSPFLINMVKIGEESGQLENMLLTVAASYEAEIEYFIHNVGQLLEPLIMIVLGVLIGGLVIAMYLPIFKLGAIA